MTNYDRPYWKITVLQGTTLLCINGEQYRYVMAGETFYIRRETPDEPAPRVDFLPPEAFFVEEV